MKRCILVGIWLLSAATQAPAAEARHDVDPDTRIERWELRDRGINLSLTQMLPDQVRAFYLARGFDRAAVEPYATGCVFQTVMGNDSAAGEVGVNLADWRVMSRGRAEGLRLEREWQQEWERRRLSEPARIAFRWAQFPGEQSFAPGDWNQGMMSFPVAAGHAFNLELRWRVADRDYRNTIKGIRCAKDR